MAKKKAKAAAKKKVKAAPAKKAKKAVKKKAMPVAKKVKRAAKSKAKPAARKKAKAPAKSTAKRVAKKKTTLPDTEVLTRGEDLHLIPKPGEEHPIGTEEAHRIENNFHNREEVAFRQENQKIKDSLATRKGTKGYRNRGMR